MFLFLARVSVRLLNREEALSVCIITFADDLSTSYISVGTAIIFEDEDTPKYGRILIYRYKNGHLNLVTEKEINGPPHAMLAFQGKLLVAIGSSVRRQTKKINLFISSFRFVYINFLHKIMN